MFRRMICNDFRLMYCDPRWSYLTWSRAFSLQRWLVSAKFYIRENHEPNKRRARTPFGLFASPLKESRSQRTLCDWRLVSFWLMSSLKLTLKCDQDGIPLHTFLKVLSMWSRNEKRLHSACCAQQKSRQALTINISIAHETDRNCIVHIGFCRILYFR